ncbi:MAG: YdcF family protein [Endozoicomonadaceae bacterium]|nr:YdcF family protein [Endozoicomonadaceae bacterium]
MREDLIAIGIPADRIYRDYAGFRTLDSVIRANQVFNLTQFTLISQQYQNERAIFIAQKRNIQAIAFNVHGKILTTDYSNRIREILARLLAVLEVLLLNTQPQILGESIMFGETPPT